MPFADVMDLGHGIGATRVGTLIARFAEQASLYDWLDFRSIIYH